MLRSCIAGASLFGLVGCTVDTVELLDITFAQGHADVDTNCVGGCGGSDRLEATIALEDNAQLPSDATVEFTQYHIDYELVVPGAPSFDTATSVVVGKGQSAPFAPAVAGDAQRQWAVDQGGTVDGRGTITISGTDHQQEPIQLTAKFEIRFGDFAASSTNSTSVGAGGSGAGGSGAGGG